MGRGMNLHDNFSTNVRMYRSFYHKTLEEFSEILGIGKSTLQEIERGNCNPTLSTISQVAGALSTSPIELLFTAYDPVEFRTAHAVLPFIAAFQVLNDAEQQRAERLLSELLTLLRPAFEAP